jgi:hypothetical protein
LQLFRVDERRENGPCLGAAFTAGEQVVLLFQAYRLDNRSCTKIESEPKLHAE